MIDFVGAVRSESARFYDLVARTPMDAAVPSCPGLDRGRSGLASHGGPAPIRHRRQRPAARPYPGPATRPTRDAELPDLIRLVSARLVEALESRDADDKCWSWHETGYTVGWVRRRQAHETLIHRVDAELAAGGLFNVDAALGC